MRIQNAIAACIAAISLTGCGTLQELIDGGGGAQELAVTYATLKYIEHAGSDDLQIAKAARVKAIALEVQEVAHGGDVTIAALEAYVMNQLPEDMSPADRYLAAQLVNAIVLQLDDRVAEGVLDAEELVAVDRLLGWVVNACDFFAPAPG